MRLAAIARIAAVVVVVVVIIIVELCDGAAGAIFALRAIRFPGVLLLKELQVKLAIRVALRSEGALAEGVGPGGSSLAAVVGGTARGRRGALVVGRVAVHEVSGII